MNFKKLNIYAGWLSFLIATIVYLLTLEPTVSFWDCGEFISSAYKLEVGHPPGAPLFMLMGRFFTFFAGDVTNVAMMVNIMSALASSFTILFLFWTITYFARKILTKVDEEISLEKTIAILSAGFVGALAYTFSDSFWFSAVEAEVYASSSLFTALVFWAIVRWEDQSESPQSFRWILLIAYLMGLSIGVHLLNLLAIPAIVLMYFFKKYEFSYLKLLFAGLIAGGLVLFMMYGFIPGIPKLGSKFDLLFVNSFGMPYNTGLAFYVFLLFALIFGLLFYAVVKKKEILKKVMLVFAMLVIGYSSFALIIIRSVAQTPMNQNAPDNAFSLLDYLNREQYGDNPLIYGPYYSTPPLSTEDSRPIYAKIDGQYEIINYRQDYVYPPEACTYFPRMHSHRPEHKADYVYWGDVKGKTVAISVGEGRKYSLQIPTFGENFKFFTDYQIGHMYYRYFMWNFAGRQNDIQSHGDKINGNWMSGIAPFDKARLGSQDKVSKSFMENKGRNKYYLLPLIFGIAGIVIQILRRKYDFWVVALLFFFTGIAIVIYLNQYPQQPRERDYAFAGSFYSFAIWIGLGVLALYRGVTEVIKGSKAAIIAGVASLALVPIIMAAENWDDHDRSSRYVARDFAGNYLNSCSKNAVLFTVGDNDTFPLWYAQEVEGVRTDVRVLCMPYLNADWYINQMKNTVYESKSIPLSFTQKQVLTGKRDQIRIDEEGTKYLLMQEKYDANTNLKSNYEKLAEQFTEVMNNSKLESLDKTSFDRIMKAKDQGPIELRDKLSNIISALQDEAKQKQFGLSLETMNQIKSFLDQLYEAIADSPIPLKDAMAFIAKDSNVEKQNNLYYLPGTKFIIPVNKENALSYGIVDSTDADLMTENIVFKLSERTIKQGYIMKDQLIVLDVLANSNWERPVCFSSPMPAGDLGLSPYIQFKGFAYQVVPIRGGKKDFHGNHINTKTLYDDLMNNFKWGNIGGDIYFDYYQMRTAKIVQIRGMFARLAYALINEEKPEKAIEVMDRGMEILPVENFYTDMGLVLSANIYESLGESEKAEAILVKLIDLLEDDMIYFHSLDIKDVNRIGDDIRERLRMLLEINNMLERAEKKEIAERVEKIILMPKFQAQLKIILER
ncbi:MAG: DUF2723 domain-containing protein [Bacteroidales bacterium]|nr:DUF2723 domain-containing protein [Bacteroidales bacterium]